MLKRQYKSMLICLILAFLISPLYAATEIEFLKTKVDKPFSKLIFTKLIKSQFSVYYYRAIKVQIIYNEKLQIDHLLIYLFLNQHHGVEIARLNLNRNFHLLEVIRNYKLAPEDLNQQPEIHAYCPDTTVEFIAFAPNNIKIEQQITNEVADAAVSHNLKTVRLLLKEATRSSYLNYMQCPRLKGNFYNGDANTEVITTVDGIITYKDINENLSNFFRYKVTNIWLACEAYNNPIKYSVLNVAKAQKYAAGINDLIVGPSDEAAACAMKAAMNGKPMKDSFKKCYLQFDDPEDKWGFGGKGSDIFGE